MTFTAQHLCQDIMVWDSNESQTGVCGLEQEQQVNVIGSKCIV